MQADLERTPRCAMNRRRPGPFLLLFLGICVWAVTAAAQIYESDVHITPRKTTEEPQPAIANPALRTHTRPIIKDVDVVLVPVTVTDPMNRLVTGLDKDNFQVLEGNDVQNIRHFSSEDAPVSLGVIFDCSGSMADKIDKSRAAVLEFFRTANPQDEFFLISFADEPVVLSDFTPRVEDIQAKLLFASAKGRTALLDAVYLSIHKMREARYPRKALLIISDGGDNHSRYTEDEIKSMVKEADVEIYAIGLYELAPTTFEEKEGPRLLEEITEVTGGHSFRIDSPNDLSEAATKIGLELRNQYVLGYRPNNPVHDGKWHKIKVRLVPPKGLPPLHVHAKTGYYAPQ